MSAYPGNPVVLPPDDEEEECRAMMIGHYHCHHYHFFCVPGVSTEWTRIVPESYEKDLCYADFAYCSTRKVFSFITRSKFEFGLDCVRVSEDRFYIGADDQIDDWNVELSSPEKADTTWFWKFEGPPHSWKENEDVELLTKQCGQSVYAEEQFDVPLIVVRFEIPVEMMKNDSLRDKTVGFVVVKIEKWGKGKGKGRVKVVEDLKGLAIFVGMNHSFAIPAGIGILKPNSIYFTGNTCVWPNHHDFINEVGIFDYEKKTISPACHHKYFERIKTHPIMWFTPNPCLIG